LPDERRSLLVAHEIVEGPGALGPNPPGCEAFDVLARFAHLLGKLYETPLRSHGGILLEEIVGARGLVDILTGCIFHALPVPFLRFVRFLEVIDRLYRHRSRISYVSMSAPGWVNLAVAHSGYREKS